MAMAKPILPAVTQVGVVKWWLSISWTRSNFVTPSLTTKVITPQSLLIQSLATKGDPILYYTWTPYWVSGVLVPGKDVVWLEVPFSSLPGERKDIDTTLKNGKTTVLK